MSEYVADEVCTERHKVVDERFSRDKQDIEDMKHSLEDKDERQRKIEQLTVEMGQMLKNHDRLLENHDKRLETLESKPSRILDKIQGAFIGAVVTGLVAAILATIIK
ncbi:MAG: hypothetical protein E7519_14120 [Ruminococcaceae bacterium]|nr:hypothetical protein [Oscillospiraceae bacterium]